MAGQHCASVRVTEVGQIVCLDEQRLGVLLGTVQGIAEVTRPCVAPLAQPCLDVAVRETLAVQQVARCDLGGVCQPLQEDGVGWFETKGLACKSPVEFIDVTLCDEQARARRPFCDQRVNAKGAVPRDPKTQRSRACPERCPHWTERRVCGILVERDNFVVYIVLLFAEPDGNVSDPPHVNI